MLSNCDAGEDSWESLLLLGDQTSHCKGNQPWIFIGSTDGKAEALTLRPPDVKSWLIGKDPNDWKIEGKKEKGEVEDKIVIYHHWLNGHEFEQTMEDSGNSVWLRG